MSNIHIQRELFIISILVTERKLLNSQNPNSQTKNFFIAGHFKLFKYSFRMRLLQTIDKILNIRIINIRLI